MLSEQAAEHRSISVWHRPHHRIHTSQARYLLNPFLIAEHQPPITVGNIVGSGRFIASKILEDKTAIILKLAWCEPFKVDAIKLNRSAVGIIEPNQEFH